MMQVLTYALGGDSSIKSTDQVNGKNIISSVANKVRSMRSAIANFLAPHDIDEFALAIA